ncbi:flagellar basal body rod protein FlgB [Paenibacillus campi]|uniref:flagellar basal body rod protein FlgB n=1 Tax=Paenibacillus campi TaxID=3106031 RepID=UPI002AFF7889|nr:MULTISPECIES: flagellar basal body rod protein FlgB [unclassified Paenibacillus]
MNLLNDVGFRRLEGALSAANLRQQVITNNIANADTPYFKRSQVSFENMLQSQLDDGTSSFRGITTNPRHFQIGSSPDSVPQPTVVTDEGTVMNNNLNNVDIDVEMSNLAENQLRYNTYIEQVNHQIKMMRTAIQGTGGA